MSATNPRPLVPAIDSGMVDHDKIVEYVESLKRRDRDSYRVGDSSTHQSIIPHHTELWMLPVPVHSFVYS